MKTHLALEVELDAPCLFNAIKSFKGDSGTATSSSVESGGSLSCVVMSRYS